eukprot:TRINITY_DN55508_c0_g1_i1.p1 TRINITY_DN55508_c0_g1~~TRINITY_DN55508_c0_g1_i1.p1  ORF type:complete len:333 (-),score=46.14 TRINITY_DN55508_c0_g1_i1:22-1020(-)
MALPDVPSPAGMEEVQAGIAFGVRVPAACARPFRHSHAGIHYLAGHAVGRMAETESELNQLLALTEKETGGWWLPARKCFVASAWLASFSDPAMLRWLRWSRHSQYWQDSVLASLFSQTNLAPTNRFYVEIGFHMHGYPSSLGYGSGSNTQFLRDKLGWRGLLLDQENEFEPHNLHRRTVTPENVVAVFQEFGVPASPDYISIDIDGCDLWIFLALTKQYSPRVVSLEYNMHYELGQAKASRCQLESGEIYSHTGFDEYGSSLTALFKAAAMSGYTVVQVIPPVDVIIVRSDLICQRTAVDAEIFRNSTGRFLCPVFAHAPAWLRERWVIDF